ncbi:MAG: YibE/F family protein [Clostridia bacterium]|jgi:uncharacterized membrane protein|nr:YibE/F family protein [Clostridia bacterium]
MKKYTKILVIIVVLFVSVYSIYGIYDPNKEPVTTNPGEVTILTSPEENAVSEGTTVSGEVTNAEDTTANGSSVTSKDYKAKVLQKISVYKTEFDDSKFQKVKVKIIDDGEYKDKEYEAEYILQVLDSSESKELEVGRTVYVMFNTDSQGNQTVVVKDVDRMPYLIIVLVIFITTIIVIGRKQGLRTVISLGITLYAIFYILVPLIMSGHSAILMSILICIFIAVVNLILVGGIKTKSFVAIVGTVSGVIVSAILAIIISNLARITGLSNEDAQMLIYVANGTSIDIYGLFFAGIIIGTVGATMDISMSIASTMNELIKTSSKISTKDLIKSGLNVGKDSIGTMSNTLILAYVGESLILIMLYMINNFNLVSIVNSDFIASEILRGLCGTIGMISAIPITTYIYGILHHFAKEKN